MCLLLSWLVALAGPLLRASTVSAMAAAVCSARTTPALVPALARASANNPDAATPDAPGEPARHGGLDCALCLVQVLAAPPPARAALPPLVSTGVPPLALRLPALPRFPRGLSQARAPPPSLRPTR